MYTMRYESVTCCTSSGDPGMPTGLALRSCIIFLERKHFLTSTLMLLKSNFSHSLMTRPSLLIVAGR